jgi:hypothetical protein
MINSEPIPLTLPLSAPKTSEQVISQRANVVRELSLRHNREVYPEIDEALTSETLWGIPVH